MKTTLLLLLAGILFLAIFPAWTPPDEGMWMPTQIAKLPWKEMERHGMKLTPAQVFDTSATCLTRAIVLLPGGTGSFVSASGLMITNHHIAFGGIQSVSSVQDDYLKNGFYAATKDAELSLPSYTAEIVTAITDVTGDILAAVSDTMSTATRADAIRAKSRDIEASNQKKADGDTQFRVSEFYNGVKFFLFRTSVLRDVRLVYAPPGSIGNFGGEVDNWMWPRHTGDFAFLRAYVAPDGKHSVYAKDNVPYHPAAFLPVSKKPIEENSFAMIMGFPGRTFRYRTATEIQLSKDELLPLQMKLFKDRMTIIEAAGKNNRATEIKYAASYRGIANTEKNIEGTLFGMKHSNIVAERIDRERQFTQFLESTPDLHKKYGEILPQIAALYEKYKTFDQKQIVLGQLLTGISIFNIGANVNDLAGTFKKDSTGKDRPADAKLADVKRMATNVFKNYDAGVDRQVMTVLLIDALQLPQNQQILAVQKKFGSAKEGDERNKAVGEFVDKIYKETKLGSLDNVMNVVQRSADDMRDDECVKFVAELQKENVPLMASFNEFNAGINRMRSKLIEAWMAWKGQDIYPDANRTLRFTYGTVKPYRPRDAVKYDFLSSLGGVIEKESSEEPFVVPAKLHDLWEKKDFGPYTDPSTKDVPVAFLANLDITGGNSGSPIMNGNGELIGVAFDGNWEAVVGDYLFQEPLNRTISVDSRYVLFLLDKFSNAKNILDELVVK
jgi:hypothetical protein